MKARVLIGLMVLMSACEHAAKRPPEPAVAPSTKGTTPVAANELPAPPLGSEPIYGLEMKLKDQENRPLGLDVFRGHPTIVTMFYAGCPGACPRLIADIQAIEDKLPAERRADLRVLLVSFDPEHDTPAALAETARKHGVDLSRWRLSVADAEGALELAAVLGIKFRPLDGGAFFHTSVITLVDGEGRPRARVDGLGRDPAEVLEVFR